MTCATLPSRQRSWDGRAAANFICGSAGAGLIVFTALAGDRGMGSTLFVLTGLVLIGTGLLCVWHELGRPLRALNVFRHSQTSWMTREALVAALLFPAGLVAATGVAAFVWIAAALASTFVVCQSRMLQAARGIPAWREPLAAPLLVVTALVEGAGLWLTASAWLRTGTQALLALFGVLVLVRIIVWLLYRRAVATTAPRAHAALDTTDRVLQFAGTLLPLASIAAIAAGVVSGAAALAVATIAGVAAAASGAQMKYALVVRAGFTQGVALVRLPVRGVPRQAPERSWE